MKLKLKLIFAVLVAAVCALAADATGKWKATFKGPDGDMELVFHLKQDGAVVTGSVVSPMGELPVSEGKMDGDVITFTVATEQFKVLHKGTVSGDDMKLKVDIGEQQMEMTAKRSQ